MSLKTKNEMSYAIDNFFFNIRQNMLHADIQDLEHGIKTLNKGGVWSKLYRAEMNTSYTTEENLKIMNLLIKQKKEIIALRQKHRDQIHKLNVGFSRVRLDGTSPGY